MKIADKRFDVAMRALDKASRFILEHYQSGFEVEYKVNGTEVTEIDKQAESIIRAEILAHFPDDRIIGEEGEEILGQKATFTWTIDPIDGTRAFCHGVPFFGSMIGCFEESGEILFGLIEFPALNEAVYAYRGQGTWWRPAHKQEYRQVKVAAESQWKDSTASCSGEEYFLRNETYKNILNKVKEKAKFFRTWGDCYGYLLLATGRIDVMMDAEMHIWDLVPVKIIVEEAGGVFSDLNNAGKDIFNTTSIATSNQQLMSDVLKG